MRLPRIRFTVRRMMVAVAAVGFLLGMVTWMERRKESFRRKAFSHEHSHIELLLTCSKITNNGTPNPWFNYHAAMTEKYERAARYPWLPVAPDPPEPK